MTSITAVAERLLNTLKRDRAQHLLKIDRYYHGEQDRPYTPPQADAEFRQLADRCITNLMPTPINAVAQSMAVDAYRPRAARAEGPGEGASVQVGGNLLALVGTPQWEFWQRNRLDARQSSLYRSALIYGHTFVLAYKDEAGKAAARFLSPLRTTAWFDDPANDDVPVYALHVVSWGDKDSPLVALFWDERNVYDVEVRDGEMTVAKGAPHGLDECPVVRFAPWVDLDGRCIGLIEPLIPLQDRINQTVFDLLVAQTYGSFKVRTVTGMAPPMLMEPVFETDHEGNRVLDDDGKPIIVGQKPKIDPDTGNPIPAPIRVNAAQMLFAEDADARFGTLDGTPLEGYIESIEMSVRHFAAISQTPPHYMLGKIANVSAEALNAAEHSLSRKINEFQNLFGQAWERVFLLAMRLEGNPDVDLEYRGEVVWRDLGAQSFAQIADGLGKFAESLEIPKRGLWHRVPNVTQNEIALWESLYEEDSALDSGQQVLWPASGRGGSLEVFDSEELGASEGAAEEAA